MCGGGAQRAQRWVKTAPDNKNDEFGKKRRAG